jgi:hypothetical protein
MRFLAYRVANIVRQFFNRPFAYTRTFVGMYGVYPQSIVGGSGGISPVGIIELPPM